MARFISCRPMSTVCWLGIALIFPNTSGGVQTRHGGSRLRKLIEFGWDEPDLEFLLRNRAVMERSPFDGCVFHVNTSVPGKSPESLTWLGWGRREFKAEEFPGAFKALAASRLLSIPNERRSIIIF